MAHDSSSGTVSPLVYPQVRAPGFGRWFMACWIGVIGGAFVVFPIIATAGILERKIQILGPPAWAVVLLPFFFLVGLGVLTAAAEIVLRREHIEIDPRTRTVTRRRSWGPMRRTLVLPGEVCAVRLMHNTRRTSGGKGSNYNSGSSYTVCALKLVTRQGEFWNLSERPETKEALRAWMLPSFVGRTTPDYEQLQRNEAIKLCAATGWRLDDRLERSETGFVPAASAPRAQKVEEIKSPLIEAPAWLKRAAPRRVRRRRKTVLLSLLGWGLIVVPLVGTAIWVGADALSARMTIGQVIGLARDGPGAFQPDSHGVAYRFAVDKHEYTQWGWNVSAALWKAAQKRGSTVEVWYLPRDPHHSYLAPPSLEQLLAESWTVTNIKLIPAILLTIAIALGMRRRGRRIARAVLLAERGRMSQGMIVRRALKAGQSQTRAQLGIDGFSVSFILRPAAEDDPNQVRYEFIVDHRKRFGYVPANLLGIFRRDGLVGVVYDPHQPDMHLPLPVIERYLTLE